MTHRDMTAMTTDQTIGAKPVLLSDDALDQVHGGARSAFEDFFNTMARVTSKRPLHGEYRHESEGSRGKTKTLTRNTFRR
ncbi:hypothetical protein [Methylobacterium organophilum]|uniref:Uncharacterized protein n=1 Tax=Methylobacterium organophilum TaxID=410 RepID=A0ABQ4T6B8_METOR|nr:hypothetical protein [Methylobacterium organophilum]GJE25795.1 hypothetical protein LKMONMHP_0635 [Methylobacterium organophilum]